MTEEEFRELQHNIFNPLAIISSKIYVLKTEGKISDEDAKMLTSQAQRIEDYIRSLKPLPEKP